MAPSSPGLHSNANRNPHGFWNVVASMFAFKSVRRHKSTHYTRVFRCVRDNMEGDFHHLDEEPVGVTIVRNPAIPIPVGMNGKMRDGIYWTKVGNEWMSSDSNDDIFLRAYAITKTEYETDLAFSLWPELRTTNRPVRAWTNLNRYLLKKWSTVITTLSLGGTSYAASQADGAINNWLVLSLCLAGVAIVGCVVFLVTNDFEW